MSAAQKYTSVQISERLEELPTLPTIVYELSRVINDPMSSTAEVEKIMSGDQSMTLKVLQLANSAYYAIPGGVANLQRAIGYIGYDAIYQLVLSASIISALDAEPCPFFDPSEFWKHSLGVAMAAESIAKEIGVRVPTDLFTCGLVHDMGKIAMYIIAPDLLEEIVTQAQKDMSSIVDAERKLDSPRHSQVGYLLSQRWRLPSVIQTTINHHHHWELAKRGNVSSEMSQAIDIVYLANVLINGMHFGNSGHSKADGIPKEVLDRLALSPERLKPVVMKIKDVLSNSSSFLKIIGR